MKTFITLDTRKSILPEKFSHDDVRYPENLVAYFLAEYTQK